MIMARCGEHESCTDSTWEGTYFNLTERNAGAVG
jgi:hypothetical protein